MLNYPLLNDNVAVISENDTPNVADLLAEPVTVILNASFQEERLHAV